MLTKLSCLSKLVKSSSFNTNLLFCNSKLNKKELTIQHIQQVKNIGQLINGYDLHKLSQQPLFKAFISRITDLLDVKQIKDPQQIKCIQIFLNQLRRFSSAEIHSNISDLLNYQLLFKQLTRLFPNIYMREGFQYRATIVSQSIPKIALTQGCQPVAVALLHYMSTYSQNSKNDLKKNLVNYLIRYFVSQKITQPTNNQNHKKQPIHRQNIITGDPNVLPILVGSSNFRKTSNSLQQSIHQLTLLNLNKKIRQITKHLNMSQMIKIYFDNFINKKLFNLSLQQLTLIKNQLNKNPKLQHFKDIKQQNGNPIIVVNMQQQFLQAIDTYINILNTDQTNFNLNQIDFRACQTFSQYFYMIFLITNNFRIKVGYQQKNGLHYNPNNKVIHQGRKIIVKQIQLWKITSQILQKYSKNYRYLDKKQSILQIIVHKLFNLLKNTFKLSKLHQQKQKTIPTNPHIQQLVNHNKSSILKILAYLPIQILKQYLQKQLQYQHYLTQLIKQCIINLPNDTKQCKQIRRNVIKLAKMKKTLFMNKQQWITIFSDIIKQDSKFQFWDVYFFLGQTSDQMFINLIPFDQIISKLSQNRGILQSKKSYFISNVLQLAQYQKNIQKQFLTKEQNVKLSREWDIQILRLHALILLTNKQAQFQSLLIKSNKTYKIKLSQIDLLFNKWLQPQKPLLHHYQHNVTQKIQQPAIFEIKQFHNKINISYNRYFRSVFMDTECYHQFKLINLILNNPVCENYLLNLQNSSNVNILKYFYTISLGLADPINRQKYLHKYPIHKICPTDLRVSTILSQDIKPVIFQYYTIQQWQYFIQFMDRIKIGFLYKQIFLQSMAEIQSKRNISYINKQLNNNNKQKIVKSKNSKGRQNKLGQNRNVRIFNKDYNYSQITQQFQHSRQFFNSLLNKALLLFINQFKYQSNNYSYLKRKINFISTFILINSHKNQNNQINYSHFINQKQKELLYQTITKQKLDDDKQIRISLHNLFLLKLFNQQLAIHILKNIIFQNKTSINRILCLSVLGNKKAIQLGFVTQAELDYIQNFLYKISSQMKYSFMWLLSLVRIAKPSRFKNLTHLFTRIYDPFHRKQLYNQLVKMKQKYQIKDNVPEINCKLMYPHQYDNQLNDDSTQIDSHSTKKSYEDNIIQQQNQEQRFQDKLPQKEIKKCTGVFKKKQKNVQK